MLSTVGDLVNVLQVNRAHLRIKATINQLAARKQRYKLRMFSRLYKLLLFTVLMITIFFVVSSMTFSGRLAEGLSPDPEHRNVLTVVSDYGARSWRYQWWLLDGWLSLLYLIDFIAIGYLWRPSPNNRRYVLTLTPL